MGLDSDVLAFLSDVRFAPSDQPWSLAAVLREFVFVLHGRRSSVRSDHFLLTVLRDHWTLHNQLPLRLPAGLVLRWPVRIRALFDSPALRPLLGLSAPLH